VSIYNKWIVIYSVVYTLYHNSPVVRFFPMFGQVNEINLNQCILFILQGTFQQHANCICLNIFHSDIISKFGILAVLYNYICTILLTHSWNRNLDNSNIYYSCSENCS